MRFAYYFSPSHGPLHFVSSHSRVTGVPRSPLRKKRTSDDANIDCRSPFKTCRAKRERKFQKSKAITILSYKNKIHLQKCNCGHFLPNPTMQSRSVVDYNRTQERVNLRILDCCSLLVFKTSQLSKPKKDSLKIIFAYREVIAWNELPNHVRDIKQVHSVLERPL